MKIYSFDHTFTLFLFSFGNIPYATTPRVTWYGWKIPYFLRLNNDLHLENHLFLLWVIFSLSIKIYFRIVIFSEVLSWRSLYPTQDQELEEFTQGSKAYKVGRIETRELRSLDILLHYLIFLCQN